MVRWPGVHRTFRSRRRSPLIETTQDPPRARLTEADIRGGAERLRERLGPVPRTMVVLGSGLGGLADALEGARATPLAELGPFPPAGVEGHRGVVLAGDLAGGRVLVQSGRFHLYEGHDPTVVAGPVRIAAAAGVRTILLTNAAGGVNPAFEPGSIMLVEDHLNLQGENPLVGSRRPDEPRFPDMTEAYDPALRELARSCATRAGVELVAGVYAAVLGPSYETPAEVRMLRALGADAVGMSTVPEVIAARAAGVRVLALSLITNAAAGVRPGVLSHEEVLEVGERAAPRLSLLVRTILEALSA